MPRFQSMCGSIFTLMMLVAASLPAAPAPFTTTTLIAGDDAPEINGDKLMIAIALAKPGELIKIEPGIYNLRGRTLFPPHQVQIEGSGRSVTTIISDFGDQIAGVIRVVPGVESEVRELTVHGISKRMVSAVQIFSDDFRLTEVDLVSQSDEAAIGVTIEGAAPRLHEVDVKKLSSDLTGIGFSLNESAATITDCSVSADDVKDTLKGVLLRKSPALLDGVHVTLASANFQQAVVIYGSTPRLFNVRGISSTEELAFGLNVEDFAVPIIKESTFIAESETSAIALDVVDSDVHVTSSTFEARELTRPHGVTHGIRLLGNGSVEVNQSNILSTSYAVLHFGTGLASFGTSRLVGQMSGPAGLFRCIFSYRGDYTARNAVCN